MALSKTGCFLSKAGILGWGSFPPFQERERERTLPPPKKNLRGYLATCFQEYLGRPSQNDLRKEIPYGCVFFFLLLEMKNLGHSEKNIFNKHFQGANSELNSLYFPRKNTLNSEEWPNLEKFWMLWPKFFLF